MKTKGSLKLQVSESKELKTAGVFAAGVLAAIAMGIAFYGRWWAGVAFVPFIVIMVKKGLADLSEKERLKNEEEFIDGVVAVSFALQAGYSVENAMIQAGMEMENLHGKSVMTKEFQKAAVRAGRNEKPEEVLAQAGKRLGIEDIKEFASVFECAKKTGGNLVEIIRRTADQMKEKHEINREIKTLISGKKFEQRILSAMPVLIILYLRFSAGEFISAMYGNLPGVICMSFCALLYAAAVIWAGRITDIKI